MMLLLSKCTLLITDGIVSPFQSNNNSIGRCCSKCPDHQCLHRRLGQLHPPSLRTRIIPLNHPKHEQYKRRNSDRNKQSLRRRLDNEIRNLESVLEGSEVGAYHGNKSTDKI